MISKGAIIGISVTIGLVTVTSIVLLVYFFVVRKPVKPATPTKKHTKTRNPTRTGSPVHTKTRNPTRTGSPVSPTSSSCKDSTSPKYTGAYKSKMLYAYIEDATDRGSHRCYNKNMLGELKMFGFDITDSPNTGTSVSETLSYLSDDCSVVTHVPSTTPTLADALDFKQVFDATHNYVEDKAGADLVNRTNVLLYEQESAPTIIVDLGSTIGLIQHPTKSKYIKLPLFPSGSQIPTDFTNNLPKLCKLAKESGFQNLDAESGKGLMTWSTGGTTPLNTQNRGNIIVEAYNIYTVCPHATAENAESPKTCLVDFVGVKPQGKCMQLVNPICYAPVSEAVFPNSSAPVPENSTSCKGVCGDDPSKWNCRVSCPEEDYCCTRPNFNPATGANCNEVVKYGGGIYDPNFNATISDRGNWIGQILGIMTAGPNDNASVATKGNFYAQNAITGSTPSSSFTSVLFFPFTSGSCPTLRAVIKTPQDFDTFCEGVKTGMKFYVNNPDEVDKIRFGAWGCPDFLLMD